MDSVPVELVAIMQYQPFVQQCLRTLESACLSNPIVCQDKEKSATPQFARHIERHYAPFAAQALRLMYFCGFVPWRVRVLPSGDRVPEALPVGSFQWRVHIPEDKAKKGREPLVKYFLTNCTCNVRLEDVHVFEIFPPTYTRSAVECVSPMLFAVKSYSDYMTAKARLQQADEWNSQPQLVVNRTRKVRSNEVLPTEKRVGSGYAGGLDRNTAGTIPNDVFFDNADIQRMMKLNNIKHDVNLYTLPMDASAELLPQLNIKEDVHRLLEKYQRDVCCIMGMPADMVEKTNGFAGQKNIGDAFAMNSRMFNVMMRKHARMLQLLLGSVYETIYGKPCEFVITPVPKLEIQSFDDLEKAVRCGAVSVDMLSDISSSVSVDFEATSTISTFDCSLRPQNLKLDLFAAGEPGPSASSCSQPPPPPCSVSQKWAPRTAEPAVEKKVEPAAPRAAPEAPPTPRAPRLFNVGAHLFVAAVVALGAHAPLASRTSTLLLLAPWVWLVPALLHVLALRDGPALLQCVCAGAFALLLPAWLTQASAGSAPERQLLFASLCTIAVVGLYAPVGRGRAALAVGLTGAGTLLLLVYAAGDAAFALAALRAAFAGIMLTASCRALRVGGSD